MPEITLQTEHFCQEYRELITQNCKKSLKDLSLEGSDQFGGGNNFPFDGFIESSQGRAAAEVETVHIQGIEQKFILMGPVPLGG